MKLEEVLPAFREGKAIRCCRWKGHISANGIVLSNAQIIWANDNRPATNIFNESFLDDWEIVPEKVRDVQVGDQFHVPGTYVDLWVTISFICSDRSIYYIDPQGNERLCHNSDNLEWRRPAYQDVPFKDVPIRST